jgi:hypothetical protein
MTPAVAKGIDDSQLSELIGLISGADSVELKLTVPETSMPRASSCEPAAARAVPTTRS